MVAAAVIGGAVIGAAGSAAAGSSAAHATKNAAKSAAQVQEDALAQQKELAAPYSKLGTDAMGAYENLLGIGKDGSAGIGDALKSTPGYQFALEQGQTGIENQASLAGGLSGNTLASLTKFNQGLADTTLTQEREALGSAVRTGQAAAAGTAQNVGAGAENIGNILTAQGQNMAGINANTIAGITKSIGGAMDAYTTNQTLTALKNQGGNAGFGGGAYSGGAGVYTGEPGYGDALAA